MSDPTSLRIRIGAGKAAIMPVIGDPASYPQWSTVLPWTRADRIRPERAGIVLEVPGFRAEVELLYRWHGDDEVDLSAEPGPSVAALSGRFALDQVRPGVTDAYAEIELTMTVPVLTVVRHRIEAAILAGFLAELAHRVELRQ